MRHRGSASTRSEVHTSTKPSSRLPVALMMRVPYGSDAETYLATARLTANLRFAPSTAPKATQMASRIPIVERIP